MGAGHRRVANRGVAPRLPDGRVSIAVGIIMNGVTIHPNVAAFLAMVRRSEGTASAPDPYAVCFGFSFTITDFSDHPAVLGVWKGVPLDFLGPEYVGKVSTAAGAYQIRRFTWLQAKQTLRLPDFTAASQDAAAILQIRSEGAYNLIETGELAAAIARCAVIWASLPGSSSGQPEQKLAFLTQAYTDAGGVLA